MAKKKQLHPSNSILVFQTDEKDPEEVHLGQRRARADAGHRIVGRQRLDQQPVARCEKNWPDTVD